MVQSSLRADMLIEAVPGYINCHPVDFERICQNNEPLKRFEKRRFVAIEPVIKNYVGGFLSLECAPRCFSCGINGRLAQAHPATLDTPNMSQRIQRAGLPTLL